jgi:oxygen-dependent protoporphyrinogen oxidase
MPDFIVIGAGISGLTVAHKLVQSGKDVIVLESTGEAGGKILTERIGGYLLEAGPNSLRIENQETFDLIEECGLAERIIQADPASKKRFILKNSHWIKLPSGPGEAITTTLFSIGAKLRVALEPFIPRTKSEDESVASFVSRRLGQEVFDHAADPFISGIYAGDPHKLSMRHAFGLMWQAEQEHGSLIKGMMKNRSKALKKSFRPKVISFPEGLSELTSVLRTSLGERLRLHEGALHVKRTQNGFVVSTSTSLFEAKTIIFALPAYDVALMLESIAPDLSKTLSNIYYPPVAVVYLGFRKEQFSQVPEGFGGLIPSKEYRKILGIIFSSSNFSNRAPDGNLLLTIIMGGACQPDIATRTNEEILKVAIAEVMDLLKPNGEPTFQHVKLWNRAIPQYNVGFGAVLSAIDATELNNSGLHFIGNYRGGISMGACIKNATELAKILV